METSITTIDQRVVALLGEQLGVEAGQITPNKLLRQDLGADSLDLVELQMAVEDEFGISLTDAQANRLYEAATVADVVAQVRELRS